MTLFILATTPHTPFPKDVEQLSRAMLTYGLLLDVLNIFSQLAVCYRHRIDI